MSKGYIRVYTGNGEGKTMAAFGVVLRAACAGKKVYVGQFVKDMKYNETHIADLFEDNRVRVEQLGRGCFINKNPEQVDIEMAHEGLKKCADIISSGEYDVVVLDEIMIAIYFNLLKDEEVLDVLKLKNDNTEVILTGRYAPQSIIDVADLVTDMQEIKHYYQKGVLSRPGYDC